MKNITGKYDIKKLSDAAIVGAVYVLRRVLM
jgi:hypothetical protein